MKKKPNFDLVPGVFARSYLKLNQRDKKQYGSKHIYIDDLYKMKYHPYHDMLDVVPMDYASKAQAKMAVLGTMFRNRKGNLSEDARAEFFDYVVENVRRKTVLAYFCEECLCIMGATDEERIILALIKSA